LRYEFREFGEVMDILGNKLGPLIFQFPFFKLCSGIYRVLSSVQSYPGE